jgi:hypothetical protein
MPGSFTPDLLQIPMFATPDEPRTPRQGRRRLGRSPPHLAAASLAVKAANAEADANIVTDKSQQVGTGQ